MIFAHKTAVLQLQVHAVRDLALLSSALYMRKTFLMPVVPDDMNDDAVDIFGSEE